MNESYEFLKQVLDTVTEHIVVIDNDGEILFVNRSWQNFGENNACLINDGWLGVNYLAECSKAGAMGDEFGSQAAAGIQQVIDAAQDAFYFEYPCHSPDEKRWFMMRVTPFSLTGIDCFVVSHQNITERKIAEEELHDLSRIDGLTDIPNRRFFDEFLGDEWQRCSRLGLPLSLAMIDIDHFKLLNDTYGHQAGDECLKKVANTLKKFAKRPSDLCARYGGEEFCIVYGNTSGEQAQALINELNEAIRALQLPNEKSPTLTILTASIGLATLHPSDSNTAREIIEIADKLLYSAKENGRNQVVFAAPD